MQTPTDRLKRHAVKLAGLRSQIELYERLIQEDVLEITGSERGSLKAWARGLGISLQYASDLARGRRKVSAEVTARIIGPAVREEDGE